MRISDMQGFERGIIDLPIPRMATGEAALSGDGADGPDFTYWYDSSLASIYGDAGVEIMLGATTLFCEDVSF